MQNSLNINTILNLQPALTSPANSPLSLMENSGGQSFNSILNEQLGNIISQNDLPVADEKYEKNNTLPESGKAEINSKNLQSVENVVNVNNEKVNNDFSNNDKESIKENINSKKITNANNLEDNAKDKKNIQETSEKNTNPKIKERKSHIDDMSVLLDNLNSILDMVKGAALDKKQMNELKSILSELRNTLELKNNQFGKIDKTDKKESAAIDGSLIKRLLERLKSMVDTANERAGIKTPDIYGKNQSKVFENKLDNKTETSEIASLKKEISKLADEIRQRLTNKKPEVNTGKNDEPIIEIKNNSNQKILTEAQNLERNESAQGKDNASNFNFSFNRKDPEGAVAWQKGNAAGTPRKEAFNEQLNTIVQNARVVVRDSKNGSFSIRLHPESLGRVNINLNLEHGIVLGKFLVDSVEAKEVLLENMSNVKESLQQNGISVGEFQVNVRGENKSFSGTNEEVPLYAINKKLPVTAKSEYELNSVYIHDGEIDLII